MYKKIVLGCLLGLSTTVISAEEPAPNQLVQVENSQLASDKTTSIRISPLSTLVGLPQLSINYAVTNKISLGLEGSHLISDSVIKSSIKEKNSDSSIDSYDISAQSYGVRADYAFGDSIMANTWYLSGGLSNLKVGIKSRIDAGEASGDLILGRALIGFQWVKQHFIINLAGGFSTVFSQEYKVSTASGWASEDQVKNIGSHSALDFSLGYVF